MIIEPGFPNTMVSIQNFDLLAKPYRSQFNKYFQNKPAELGFRDETGVGMSSLWTLTGH